jgi:endonuclease YncB( thermonuclease family)
MFLQIFAFLILMCSALNAEPISINDILVKDGDTIYARGIEFRMVGYDSPEMGNVPWRRVSTDERALGELSKARLIEILGSRQEPIDLTEVPCSCSAKKLKSGTCNHKRKCGILSVNGESVGKALIAEELAMPFVCSATRCPRMPDWPRIIEGYNKR